MPKKVKELSSIEVRKLSKPGKHSVGGVSGLLLQISKTQGKSWVLRTLVGSKRLHIGLGGYPDVTLSMARDKAREKKFLIYLGKDPIETKNSRRKALVKKSDAGPTFEKVAQQFISKKSAEFKPSSRAKQVQRLENSLKQYVYPFIGDLPVSKLEIKHLRQILEPIWETKTETANRVRQRVEKIIDLATVQGYRKGDNPARWKGTLSLLFPEPNRIAKVKHFNALPISEIPHFISKLQSTPGIGSSALLFSILTASRSGEIRGATWSEIDFENKVWTIPEERMKAGKEHQVPLSEDAITILKSIPRLDDSEYLFPNPQKKNKLSENGMTQVLRRMGVSVTQHGFRSTFKDWCRIHTTFPDEISELALAHVSSDSTRAAYARDQLLDQRRDLSNQWSKFCFSQQE